MKFLSILLMVFTLSVFQNLAFAGGDSDGDCTSRYDGARTVEGVEEDVNASQDKASGGNSQSESKATTI